MSENIFEKIKGGLKKTRDDISAKIGGVISSFKKIDEEFYEELEETLILCDMGVAATTSIIKRLRDLVKERKVHDTSEVKTLLRQVISEMLTFKTSGETYPCIILIVGVNGVGKTTAIGKLAHLFVSQGKSVVLAAADTFRAAAGEQLTKWGERSGAKVVMYGEGADPAAVVFDAIDSAKHRNTDVVICDTAGRLHNKKNLMNELSKINRVIDKAYGEVRRETYLVLDATTGQNAIAQAREFNEAVPLTGLILTKVDGTAKGGIVCAVCEEFKLPVKYLGVGEGMEDLEPFDPEAFSTGLLE